MGTRYRSGRVWTSEHGVQKCVCVCVCVCVSESIRGIQFMLVPFDQSLKLEAMRNVSFSPLKAV